jgi:hypothetical protein
MADRDRPASEQRSTPDRHPRASEQGSTPDRHPRASEQGSTPDRHPPASEQRSTPDRDPPASERRTTPDLDYWLPDPSLRVAHRRESRAAPERLWQAARTIRLSDTRLLGRLVRWRIPGVPADLAFDELFRSPPFSVLWEDEPRALTSGLVGRIWTLRRDYPELSNPDEFRAWAVPGTARVLFANWIELSPAGRSAIRAEVRVEAIGAQGRVGLAAVRPLVGAFGYLIGSDGIELAARRAERGSG